MLVTQSSTVVVTKGQSYYIQLF